MPTGADKKTTPQRASGSTARPGASRPPDLGRLVKLCVASWLVPGLGHWLLKRRRRAVILFAAIIAMFIFGVLMKGQFYALASISYLERLGYLAELCTGLAMPVTKFFGYGGGNPFFISSDYGTAYLVSAGMLNLLTILDAYDIAVGRKS